MVDAIGAPRRWGRLVPLPPPCLEQPGGHPLIPIGEFLNVDALLQSHGLIGADALQGYHADARTRFSEEYQASVYEHQVAMLKRTPFLRGVTPWILTDFRSPRRPLPGIQDYWNRKGLVSDRGIRKQAFFVLQRYYREVAETFGSRQ